MYSEKNSSVGAAWIGPAMAPRRASVTARLNAGLSRGRREGLGDDRRDFMLDLAEKGRR
jgi:hypothetical protein